MKKSLTEQLALRPIWIGLGVALLIIAALSLAVVFLTPRDALPDRASTLSLSSTPGDVSTTASSLSSTPTSASTTGAFETATPGAGSTTEPPAASVNGYNITRSYLSQTVRLNEVLGELSGAPTFGEEETLQRLILSELILQGVTATEEPTQHDVESFIASLEEDWGVSDETVVQRLQAAGLDRAFLVHTIERLLAVEAGVQSLQDEGHSIAEWLTEQERDADITVSEHLVSEEETEASPTAQPTAETGTPTPGAQSGSLDVAPDFTLSRAGGGSFTLLEQLDKGPLVLVFFEKCG